MKMEENLDIEKNSITMWSKFKDFYIKEHTLPKIMEQIISISCFSLKEEGYNQEDYNTEDFDVKFHYKKDGDIKFVVEFSGK